jgi:hypothetical protein
LLYVRNIERKHLNGTGSKRPGLSLGMNTRLFTVHVQYADTGSMYLKMVWIPSGESGDISITYRLGHILITPRPLYNYNPYSAFCLLSENQNLVTPHCANLSTCGIVFDYGLHHGVRRRLL